MSKQGENNSKACAPVKREKDILQHMIDGAKNIHLVYLDRDFNFVRVNQAYADTSGYKPKEMVGKNHFALYPHEGNEAIFKRVRDTGVPAHFRDKPFTFPDQPQRGVTYWDWTLEPIKNSAGKVVGLVLSLVETTERKRAEEALVSKEREHHDLFENMTDGFAYCQMIFDNDGKPIDLIYLEINDAFEKITGLNRQQVIGRKITEAIPGTEKANPEIFEIYGRVALTCQKERFEIFFKPLKLWLSISVYCPRIGYFAAIFEDITERKQSQEKLRQYSEQLEALVKERTEKLSATATYARGLIEASLDPLVTISPQGKITDVNNATEAVTGCSREELIGSDFSDYFTEPEKARAGYMKVFTDGFVRDYPLAIRHKSGKVTEVLYNATVYTNVAGEMQGVFAAARDITDLKKAENILSKKQEELNRILDSSPTIIFYKDREGKVIQANKAFADALKASKEELLGKTVFDLYSSKIARGMTNADEKVFASKRPKMNIEEQYESPTGLRWLRTDKIPTFDEKGAVTGLIGFSEDITERKKAEELAQESAKKLKDAERLAAIGATAGMVGHDIRNPLQAIVSDVYLLKDELSSMPEGDTKACVSESLDGIEKNISYINKIVADLQDYARPITPVTKETELEQICQEILQKNIPINIKATCKIDKTVKQVTADPELLKRVIANLVTNAVQAMPKGGKLTINAYREKSEVVIEVQDTGEGIPDEVKTKLFTPLFTTKSKGQGFGLAVVKRVTESMNGTVSFESEKGKGTKFIVRLPPPQELNGK
jgi:PAS domain S-box-containing protein